ncbi:phospho-N-acetylmuramoyl-pentapeptide-transferase [Christensenella sp. MSJ-20]|uniref:phospho-N-acetylmuramoyl-pentapeptide- transferase n=1 Tax=Christensenella sp. MSJ-20 TaxID=2841518 RepID=UPI001C75C835|nr:phospho-N-acetylmuramoyl-pentapeptide-transferase [Christensenella sp. MSJ-20]
MEQLIWPLVAAFAASVALGPMILTLLRKLKLGQNVRDDGPASHLAKAGTPSMGGIIFILGGIVATVLFARGNLKWVIFCVLTTLGYGAVGFLDDFIKVHKHRSLGLKPYQKMIGQLGLAVVIAMFAASSPEVGTKIYVPFANFYWDLGWFYYPFTVFVVVGVVNSVNLTDGLDGLASGVSVIVCATFAIIAYSLALEAEGAGETLRAINYKNLAVFASAMAGGCLAFLRFNSFPAKVFMGDTGSLALGGVVVILAILSRMVLLLPICAGMFMASTISSIAQVISYKFFHKRILKMAPLHHHFELCGVNETKIVASYIMISVGLCALTLALVL